MREPSDLPVLPETAGAHTGGPVESVVRGSAPIGAGGKFSSYAARMRTPSFGSPWWGRSAVYWLQTTPWARKPDARALCRLVRNLLGGETSPAAFCSPDLFAFPLI